MSDSRDSGSNFCRPFFGFQSINFFPEAVSQRNQISITPIASGEEKKKGGTKDVIRQVINMKQTYPYRALFLEAEIGSES